ADREVDHQLVLRLGEDGVHLAVEVHGFRGLLPLHHRGLEERHGLHRDAGGIRATIVRRGHFPRCLARRTFAVTTRRDTKRTGGLGPPAASAVRTGCPPARGARSRVPRPPARRRPARRRRTSARGTASRSPPPRSRTSSRPARRCTRSSRDAPPTSPCSTIPCRPRSFFRSSLASVRVHGISFERVFRALQRLI